ncbi:Efflux ABC transporter, permease/ATP-binding protein [Enhygromyxa salina]|uniref:Efflux ABC transporter, permease/ATP-binding protein n=1 Tax=Enhygromyxa salina TaxID=215803 RepID=A0A0C2CS52_9BACT|nr:ABC transporter transmembrane domain-containing protein [Enhygromyxa salina]KIG14011.1 Efflux ABC transporter, permease/ATP-binding protein [Enhygromyxa salina]
MANSSERGQIKRRAPLRQFRRLFGYARRYRARLLVAAIALVITVLAGLVVPWFFGELLGDAFAQQDAAALDRNTAILVAAFLIQAVFLFIRHYLMSWVGERVVTDLRLELHRHLLAMPQAYFHERRTGELLSRLSDDASRLQSLIGADLNVALRNLLTLVGGVIMLLVVSPVLTGTVLLIIPPMVIVARLWSRVIRRLAQAAQDELASASGRLQEGLGAIGTVQAFTRERHEASRYAEQLERAFGLYVKKTWVRSWFLSVSSVMAFGTVAGIFWLGGHMVIEATLTPPQLGKFFMFTLTVAGAVGNLTGVIASYNQAVGATSRLFEILDLQPSVADRPDAVELAQPHGALHFSQVSFSYDDRDTEVISDFDLKIAPGEVCALVGSSGSGKTTIGRLLLRFWDPQAGQIYFDGLDLRELSLASLRGAMAEVSQDPVLFTGSIRENIRYGRLDAADDEVEAAAHAANAHDFICEFPEGYATVVGERGVKLSGGQRQRVAIARAILRDPRVLLLDEATSALDSESEYAVQAALEQLQRGRTTIVIAHRLSTIREADRIVVLDHGRVVEQGKHDALMELGGTYAKLVARQAAAETERIAS